MAGKGLFELLPKDVVGELKNRYCNQPNLTIDDHYEWLMTQGFNVSRYAVGRLIKKIKIHNQEQNFNCETELKSRCLEIASKYTDNKKELFLLAEELYFWTLN